MTNTYAINPNTTDIKFAPVSASSTSSAAKSVTICDTQPVTAEGVRNLLSGAVDLRFQGTVDSLQQATLLVQSGDPDVLILDKAFGIQAVLDWLAEQHSASAVSTLAAHRKTSFVIWGVSISEAEAVRFLQAGARGILRKTAGVQAVLACLRTVAAGGSWTEDSLFGDAPRTAGHPRSELTGREQQVLELVQQGFKNKDIGNELGIRPGTVKIHLKHIFQKTGVRGRYGLAFNSMKGRLTAAA